MALKDLFRELVLEKGVTVKEISSQTGVSKQALHNIRRGVTKRPQMDTLIPLAKYFGVELKLLVDSIDEEPGEAKDRFAELAQRLNDQADTIVELQEELKRQAKENKLSDRPWKNIEVDNYQKEYLSQRYIPGGNVLVVELAGVSDLMMEEFYQFLAYLDDQRRKRRALNNGATEKQNGEREAGGS